MKRQRYHVNFLKYDKTVISVKQGNPYMSHFKKIKLTDLLLPFGTIEYRNYIYFNPCGYSILEKTNADSYRF